MALACALLLAGCGSGAGDGERVLTVFAAASLTEPFEKLADRFEADNPGVRVELVLSGSSGLARQLTEGAPSDVFASADKNNMEKVAGAGLADGAPHVFATNELTIAVEPGNPLKIKGLADLARTEPTVVVCAPEVPCGAAARAAAWLAGVRLAPDSEEPDVKSVLGKVRAGEADLGLVYASDVVSSKGAVQAVDFPQAGQVVNSYPIAALKDADEPELARSWIALVRSEQGTRVLEEAGFGPP